MSRVIGRIVIALSCVATAVVAQERPMFAGVWTPIEGVNPPVELVVTQTATRLTAKAGADSEHVAEYLLDGTESVQGDGTGKSRVELAAARMTVTNSFVANGTAVSVQKQVWTIDSQGQLVIETIRERNGETVVRKSVYRRKPSIRPAG